MIIFNPMTPFASSNFWDNNIQQYIKATGIRIRLEYPWTDGNHVIQQEQFLNQYYYDITDVDINARCHCNGHGQFCIGNLNQLACRCVHNTEGVDCERCLPLYNNRTWSAATSTTQTNPCQSELAIPLCSKLYDLFTLALCAMSSGVELGWSSALTLFLSIHLRDLCS